LDEVEAYQALASKSRLQILKLLYKNPLSIEEISKRIGLQPITVRHHLQSLEEAGFVESYEERKGTVGRPKVYYRIAKKMRTVSFPKRRYLTLSNFLITTMRFLLGLDRTKKILRKVGVEMGENTVKELEVENEIKEWSLENYRDFFINKYLKEAGAEPEIIEANDEKIVYRLHNCVFFELAIRMTEMICDVVHEGFHEGVSNGMGKKVRIRRLTCMGKGDPYCEHVCELLTKKG
jgi:predicted ArsR family transcriptional regulator